MENVGIHNTFATEHVVERDDIGMRECFEDFNLSNSSDVEAILTRLFIVHWA